MRKIKKYMDGLTSKTARKKYPWIFKASIENAVIGETANGLVWYDGWWIDGVWHDGKWMDGVWRYEKDQLGVMNFCDVDPKLLCFLIDNKDEKGFVSTPDFDALVFYDTIMIVRSKYTTLDDDGLTVQKTLEV